MISSFLATKLYIPAPRANNITRPDLLLYLQQNLEQGKQFFLICAAAGYGKTTLLSQWLQQLPYPAGWVTLDSNDNHLAGFWSYICRAFQNVDPALGMELLEALQSNQEAGSLDQIKRDLNEYINNLAKRNDRIILVLDDYHLIENDEIQESLAYFIEHMPPCLILVVISRVDPALPLARWRSRGQMAEVRTANLQFSLQETDLYLQSNIRLQIPESLLNLLYKRTEGWIAALQMLGLALQQPGQSQPQDTSIFLQRMASNQRYIIDYLFEEVIHKEKSAVQEFLLITSILEPLSAELCVQVVQNINGIPLTIDQAQQTLETLNRENLFIEAIDPEECWFRYHHLFAEILQSRLRRDNLERYQQLHVRASDAYQDLGLADQAIQHAIASENTDMLIKRIFENAPAALKHSNVNQCRHWLELLPKGVLTSSLEGSIMYAWALFLNHDIPATLAWLPKIETLLEKIPISQESNTIQAEYLAILATIRLNQKQYTEAIHLCKKALQSHSHLYVTGIASHTLGYASYHNNDFDSAASSFEKAIADSFAIGNLIPATSAVKGLVDSCIRLGQVEHAETVCKQTLALFREKPAEKDGISFINNPPDSGKFPRRAAGMILIGLGDIYYLKNNSQASRNYYNEAIQLLSIGGYLPLTAYAHIGLARILQDEEQLQVANDALQQARDIVHKGNLASFSCDMDRELAHAGLLQNNVQPAEHWARLSGIIHQKQFSNLYTDQDWLVYAYYLSKIGEQTTAADLIDALINWAKSNQYSGSLIHSLALKITLLAQNRQTEAARQILGTLFQFPGWQSYTRWIDSARTAITHSTQPAENGEKPIESISPREVEILQLMAEGCSNQDISERYFISIHTVKSHLKHIFVKLDVENRSQAVHRARQLGIIS
jgi:LuxR family transcriptional regulator, maltose regulon positive regulatory protein